MNIIYTQDNCMQCKMAKTVMDGEGIPYEEVYIESEEQREDFRNKGFQSTPVIISESGEEIIGFKPDKIKGLK